MGVSVTRHLPLTRAQIGEHAVLVQDVTMAQGDNRFSSYTAYLANGDDLYIVACFYLGDVIEPWELEMLERIVAGISFT